ncbi:hypothetical protein GLAREA_02735 [Glarea lozoyensis ATCC 20868]|uniref:Uncharacterized protein n=1 Tax=Glarea lozoyensis (strain ATCC 20868 / MF5171) TaxID=1116229 RepID=S3D454_GLAL2|nr:uncharacterized protein GLAREA_02735 [Glarea lozoyensis ATCC 20868]EPE26821.1 hypothetical protein GLAREA_02735 [Glarea lozoyensis ATCC 20868]
MASLHPNINGTFSPTTQQESTGDSMTLSAKRKRDETSEINPHANSINNVQSTGLPTAASIGDTQANLRDLIDVLKDLAPVSSSRALTDRGIRFDTIPSILTRPLPPRTPSTEPQAKRQKSDDAADSQSTIIARAASQVYQSFEDVIEDIDRAVSDIEEKMQLPNPSNRNQYIPATEAQSELALNVSAFRKRAHEIASSSVNSGYATNGNVPASPINAGAGDGKMVLTLYGNAPGPKQLFSSFQKPPTVDAKNAVPPIREAGLPNGITTTKILALQSSNLVEQTKQITLGDLFPSPANLPPLQPPKPSKNSTTRSSNVGWYQPSPVEPFSRSGGYSKAQLTCGQWLDYSNASPPQSSKKRQRDRAMSLGGAKAPVPENNAADSETARQEALFRSAYSSFAPTKDDSAAVAPTSVLARLWWQQSGERHFERLVENVTNLDLAITSKSESPIAATDDEEMKSFEEAVEIYEKDAIDPSLVSLDPAVEKSVEEKDVEEVLEGISELLETLNSYQRNRHLSLNPAAGRPGILSAPDTLSLGTPSKPSDSEQATYEMLKSQLTLMISTLPPYAVSKLDPDRLADLRISTKIEVRLDDFRGVMEEDETAAKVRAAATANTASVARVVPPTTHRSSSTALYGNQYSAPRAPSTPSHGYYGAAQTPARTQQQSVQRAPSAGPVSYTAQRPTAPAPFRGSQPYNNAPGYGQATPRPTQQYPSSGQTPYSSTPVGQSYNMRPTTHTYQNTPQPVPQAAMNGRGYTPQSVYPHQAQTAQNGQNYGYNATQNIARQSSPQTPMYSAQTSHLQGRGYATPAASNPQFNRQYLQAPMVNGGTPQPALNAYNQHQSSNPTGYNTHLSHQEQSNMIERQRAQMQAQQASQQQVRNTAPSSLGGPAQAQSNGVAAGQ